VGEEAAVIVHEVLTTEKVPFRYRVAGLGSRFLAWLTDAALIAVLALAAALFFGALEQGREGLGSALVVWGVFALNWDYFLLFEWLWGGQTPGKRLLGIRVIRRRGTAVSFWQSAVRNVLRFVDAPLIPGFYCVGFAVAACNRENRRLGDLAADTLVVHVERRGRPLLPVPEATTGGARAPRQRPSVLDREQRQTLLDLCLRREQLRPVERALLFRETARYIEGRTGLAPEPAESDEKFVLRLARGLED
jgi:uncharacterized RDD family membrane protein YckC